MATETARRNCSSQPLAPLPGSSVTTMGAQLVRGVGSAAVPILQTAAGSGPSGGQQSTLRTQRVTQEGGHTAAAAPTQLQHGSQAAAASPQLPRSHAEEALGELDAELLRMLAEADLIVASRSAIETGSEPWRTSATGTLVGACETRAESTPAAPRVAASLSGLSRPRPPVSAVAPPSLHPTEATAAPLLPAFEPQVGDTQIQAVDRASQKGQPAPSLTRAVGGGDAAPGAVHSAGHAVAAVPAAVSNTTAAAHGSGVFAGCSDDDDDIDWEAVIAAPPAGPCDVAPSAAQLRKKHHSSGDPVAEPSAGPDALPACMPAEASAAAVERCDACDLICSCYLRTDGCGASADGSACPDDAVVMEGSPASIWLSHKHAKMSGSISDPGAACQVGAAVGGRPEEGAPRGARGFRYQRLEDAAPPQSLHGQPP